MHLICQNTDLKPRYEKIDKQLVIHRLPFVYNSYINKLLNLPSFIFNPAWMWTIYRILRREKIKIVIVREMYLVLATKFLLPPGGALIFDMAENTPALMKYAAIKFRKESLILPIWLAKIVEQLSCKFSDHVMVVIEEQKERLIRQGIREDKISIVSSTPIFSKMVPDSQIPGWLYYCDKNNFLKVTYLGDAGPHRGIDTLLRAIPFVVKEIKNVRFIIIGPQKEKMPILQSLLKRLRVEEWIILPGYVPFNKALSVIKQSDICIVPHKKNEHINTTIPNKLFDYMFFGKPVIVSDAKPLGRIVTQERCGLVFNSDDPEDLAQKIIKLLKEPQLRKKFGENARKAIIERYNWNKDEQTLMKIISKFI